MKCEAFNKQVSPYHHLCDEESFRGVLCNERKRAERSRKAFILLLINIEQLLAKLASREVVDDMLAAMCLYIRDTDLCGWYRRDAEIGIIFTEIDEADLATAIEVVTAKVRSNLFENLPLPLVRGVVMQAHPFPERPELQPAICIIDSTLYPEVSTRAGSRKAYSVTKRIIDIAGGLAGLLLFAPFFLTIPLLIKLTSEGPVFFRQERIGRFGEKFVFLKFRTMFINNDEAVHREYIRKLIAGEVGAEPGDKKEDGTVVYKLLNDPRVTPVGRFLRKTSLDEIPQFINVLKGDMSLVGPRPAIPYEFESYDFWHRHRLLQVKPGITGLWQVKGRSSTAFDDMVRLDLQYIRECSTWLDIKLMLLTPWVVLKGKGAY